jgi:hypothetical protein
MGAYLPVGIGFWRRNSQDPYCRNWSGPDRRTSVDPLLRFTEQLDSGGLDGHSETANIAGLFACAGAVRDQTRRPRMFRRSSDPPDILKSLPNSVREWQPLSICPSLRSRIMLLESADERTRRIFGDSVRRRWLQEGMIVTAYGGGRVRISLPLQLPEHADRFASTTECGFATACGTS